MALRLWLLSALSIFLSFYGPILGARYGAEYLIRHTVGVPDGASAIQLHTAGRTGTQTNYTASTSTVDSVVYSPTLFLCVLVLSLLLGSGTVVSTQYRALGIRYLLARMLGAGGRRALGLGTIRRRSMRP